VKAIEVVVREPGEDEAEDVERKWGLAVVGRVTTRDQVAEVFVESDGEVLELAHRWCPSAAPLMVARCTCRRVKCYRLTNGGKCRRGYGCPDRPCCRWKDRRWKMTLRLEWRELGLCKLHGLGQSNQRP